MLDIGFCRSAVAGCGLREWHRAAAQMARVAGVGMRGSALMFGECGAILGIWYTAPGLIGVQYRVAVKAIRIS